MSDLNTRAQKTLQTYDQDTINQMSEKEFIEYVQASSLAGNEYMFNGKQKGIDIEKFQNDLLFFGTTTKRLMQQENGTWKIAQGAGLLPEFSLKPIMLNKEQFREKMSEVGVPAETLKEYFAFVPDYTDF